MKCLLTRNSEALPGVLGNRGKRVFISGEQRPNFEGNRGIKTILGNWEHKKTNFRFLGNRGTSQVISGEQGNRYPPGRASTLCTSHYTNSCMIAIHLSSLFTVCDYSLAQLPLRSIRTCLIKIVTLKGAHLMW